MKKAAIAVVTLVVLIAIAAVVMLGSLDTIVKAAVEKVGTQTTQSQVSLGSATIDLANAKGALNNLSVANPEGFSGNKAISIGGISLTLDRDTLTSDTVVIKEIAIDQPAISYELGKGGNNFDALKRNIQGASKAAAKEPSEKGVKLIIENLYIRDGNITVSAPALGGKEMHTQLPTIHLKEIGKQSGGATPAEVAEKILTSLTQGAGSAVAKLDLSQFKDLGGVLQQQGSGATETLKEGLGDTGEKLQGLFK